MQRPVCAHPLHPLALSHGLAWKGSSVKKMPVSMKDSDYTPRFRVPPFLGWMCCALLVLIGPIACRSNTAVMSSPVVEPGSNIQVVEPETGTRPSSGASGGTIGAETQTKGGSGEPGKDVNRKKFGCRSRSDCASTCDSGCVSIEFAKEHTDTCVNIRAFDCSCVNEVCFTDGNPPR